MRRCTFLLLVILSAALHAQNVSGVAISALPGMPFTGQQTIVWTHQVNDKTVTSRLVGTVARDGQGRTYREAHSFSVDPVDPRAISQTRLSHFRGLGRGRSTTDRMWLAIHALHLLSSPQRQLLKRPPSPRPRVKKERPRIAGQSTASLRPVPGCTHSLPPSQEALDLSRTFGPERRVATSSGSGALPNLKVGLSELCRVSARRVPGRLSGSRLA